LKFIAPYKAVLFRTYGHTLLLAVAVLFLNVFGAALALNRKFLLKDTGRKLSHLDRQFQGEQPDAMLPPEEEELN
jgi:hypothetical protein